MSYLHVHKSQLVFRNFHRLKMIPQPKDPLYMVPVSLKPLEQDITTLYLIPDALKAQVQVMGTLRFADQGAEGYRRLRP